MPNYPLSTPTNHHCPPLVIYRDTIIEVGGGFRALTSESTAAEIADFLRTCKRITEIGTPMAGPVAFPRMEELDVPPGTTFANLTDVLAEINNSLIC